MENFLSIFAVKFFLLGENLSQGRGCSAAVELSPRDTAVVGSIPVDAGLFSFSLLSYFPF